MLEEVGLFATAGWSGFGASVVGCAIVPSAVLCV